MTTHNIVGAELAARIFGRGIGIALAAFFLAVSNPALADDECGTQIDSGNPESFDCPDADYDNGVTYTTDGDLTLNFTNGSLSDIGGVSGDGIGVTGQGTDSVTIDSATTGTELDSDGVTEALIGVTTVDGGIDIDTDFLDADFAPTTHGIFAQSTGVGSIFIDTTGNVDARSGTNPDASIGIEALTNSGDIALTTGGATSGNSIGIRALSGGGDVAIETNGTVSGDEYGILAETAGSGALTITAGGQVNLPSGSQATESSVAAIDATTGTGLLTINVTEDGNISGGGGSVNTGNVEIDGGIPIRTDAGGDQVINVASGGQVRNSRTTTMDLTATGTTTVNNAGTIRNQSGSTGSTVIRASGGSLTLNNDNLIQGVLDFSGLTDGYVFNNNAGATWNVVGFRAINELGAGTLNNAGTIDFRTGSPSERNFGTVISAPGTDFTGTGDSLLEMAVFLDGTGQASCADAITTMVADCLDLSGGSTAGQTMIRLELQSTTLVTGPLTQLTSANSGIVLVDVNGGTSQADHFVLDPDSFQFVDLGTPGGDDTANLPVYAEDPIYGAVLDIGGLFDYTLLYNPDAQQHVLAGVPQRQAIEYVAYIDEATSLWHTTSDAVAGRQADLRDGATGKLWARVVSDSSERDATPTHTSHGNSFQYEHGYSLDSDALILGSDLTAGDDYVFGLHVGAVRSTLDFDDSDTRDKSKGAVFGAYGGWWNEAGLSLDGTLNANLVKLDHNVAGFENSETSYVSFGARVEAGWRLPLMAETLYVQPLATAAYVTTDFEDLELEDNTIGFEDSTSLRGALGARLGGEMELNRGGIAKLGYWLTARAWEEQVDEGEIRYATQDGGHLAIKDDRSGSFEEVNCGVSASNEDGTVSGYLSGGATSGDDSDSFNVSIGARLNW